VGAEGVLGDLGGALHRRPEVEGPAAASLDPGHWPPSPARSRLLELTGGQQLEERFLLRQRRTQRAVSDGTARIGILSLDRVLVLRRGNPVGRLWCVELEVALEPANAALRGSAAKGLLGGLLSDLLAVGGLAVEPLTKLERAVALLDHVAA
jgi:hypothetical protein